MKILLGLTALLAPVAALAAQDVTLNSTAFVERSTQDASGQVKTVLEAPKKVVPGDHVVFVLTYKNVGGEPATDFVITNPMPTSVVYDSAEGEGLVVSVDGGKNWGALAALTITQPDGTVRPAAAADVTHLRWKFATAIPAGQGGKLSFRGVVK